MWKNLNMLFITLYAKIFLVLPDNAHIFDEVSFVTNLKFVFQKNVFIVCVLSAIEFFSMTTLKKKLTGTLW